MLPAGPTDHTASALSQARRMSASVGSPPAVQHFIATLPGRVLATDDFRIGTWPLPRAQALRAREIAPDPEGWLTALRFDIDESDAATRWLDAELPPPNLIITNRRNGHAHAVYFLARWVRLENRSAVSYADAVRRALTAAMGADPAYAGRFQHNPMHADFAVSSPRSEPYELAELAQHLDLAEPSRRTEISSLGRNCEAFDRVRQWAYGVVDGFRREGSENAFREVIRARVESVNAALATPLPACEVRSIAKSIAGWTWHVYRSRDPKAAERRRAAWRAREELRKAKRAAEGRSAQVLLEQMLKRHRLVTILTNEGRSVAEVAAATGLSRRHVQRLRALSAGKTSALSSAARGIEAEGRNGGAAGGSVPQGREPGPAGTRPNPVPLTAQQRVPSVPTPSEFAREALPAARWPEALAFPFSEPCWSPVLDRIRGDRRLRRARGGSAFGCSAARSP